MANKTRKEARKIKHIRNKKAIFGTIDRPRLVIYKSLKNFEAQLVDDQKRHTIAFVSTTKIDDLKYGGNIEAAKKVAEKMIEKIQELKINQIIFDRSGYIYHGRVKAFVEILKNKGIKL